MEVRGCGGTGGRVDWDQVTESNLQRARDRVIS